MLRRESTQIGGNVRALPEFHGFDIIDATAVSASLLGHSYFAESVQILNDLALLLKKGLAPNDRSVTLEPVGTVWAFRP
jgi:hypothetical protein